jgi:hypothetical protein
VASKAAVVDDAVVIHKKKALRCNDVDGVGAIVGGKVSSWSLSPSQRRIINLRGTIVVEGTISHPHVVEKIPSSSHESIDSLL